MSGKEVVLSPDSRRLAPILRRFVPEGCCSCPGVNPSTGEAAGTSFEAQARQAFTNLDTVLKAGGSQLKLVVNTTILVSDISNFPEVNRLFTEFFSENPPARMTMQVPLPKGLLISIGCVASVEE